MGRIRTAAIAAALVVGVGAAPAQAAVPDLERTSATELAAMLKAGQLTSVELTKAYIDRIAAVNQRGPALNAVRSLNPNALKEARVSDLARRTHSVRGPLEGLPVLLKDNIDVAGMPTTASSIVLEHSVPDKDAFVVQRLKAAGAVILGKVNLTEFAAWVSNNQSSGNGSLHGQVLNPYDTSADPGGSSAGSGVAAASGLAALVLGSDTEGSILSPATQNGVVGIRPTTGLWSRTGVVPISESQDTLGPLVQTTSDAALLLNALTAVDPEDPHTADTAQVAGTDYTAGLTANALQGARIAVSNSTNAQYVAARNALQSLGATIVQINIPNFATAQSLQTREFRRDLNKYLSRLPANAPIKSYDEANAYFHNHPEEGLKYGDSRFGPPAQYHLENPDEQAEYEGVKTFEINRARTYLDGLLNGVDAVLQTQLGLISPAAFAGYPIVSVPGGFPADTGRPVNITFVGRRFSEAKLLGFAYAYEQATKLRKPPSEINPATWRCVTADAVGCGPFAGFAGPLTDALIPPALDLEHLSINDIQRRFANNTLTPSQLVKAYIDRIHFVNNQGPGMNPVRALNPNAAAEAAAPKPGPLSGIPVLVSDTIDVAGMPTTGGSLALADVVPAKDAAIVTRLKAAGAIILGKVNVTELNGMVATGMPAGYGSLHGQVLNPYDVRTSTNGSSAGAVAAAAAGLAAATVGVETDATTNGTNNATNSASIDALAPAAATGVAAFRPTFGLVSRTGVLPVARSQDIPAPVGKSVADIAAVLSGLVGEDDSDATTANAPATAPDYAAGLTKSALSGKRIGVIAPTSGNSLTPFNDAVAEITSLGATAVPLTAPSRPTTAKIVDREFKRDLDAYLAPYGKSTAGIVAFNDAHAADTLKFGQARLRAAAAIDLNDPATATSYNNDLANGRAESKAYIDTLLANAGAPVDAILSLTATMAEVGVRAGYPQVSIPAGYDPTARRPQSISFTGTAGDDAKLLGFGYAYERAALVRQTPSEVMPQTWHCVAPIVYIDRSSSCGPGEVAPADVPDAVSVPAPVGGAVGATLSLTLGAPATFGAFTPGVTKEYTASTTANVLSTALDATLTVSDPGHLMNGTFALPEPLQVSFSKAAWTAPVSNDPVTIGFKQTVKASDALRTGAYSKTLTFTLSTTNP
ncbi:amidase family protein [Solirubrobacter soli]|uniref:amidase family protein n=1 Tax=Solirubrobacter soli TaxID=363832 RepID=UPI0004113384|nr:amidase family protein [Solirubrobacter soli]